MKLQFSAGIIVYRMKNNLREYLLLQYLHGHWDLPKGKIEKAESKREAALRELKEETNISAQIQDGFEEQLSYFFKQNGELIKKTVYFFVGLAEGDTITLSNEHIGYEWLPYEKAIERLSFDNAKEVVARAEKFLR